MHCFYATLAVCVYEVNIHSRAQLIITLSRFNRIALYLYSTEYVWYHSLVIKKTSLQTQFITI
jgi:hypothetical protein